MSFHIVSYEELSSIRICLEEKPHEVKRIAAARTRLFKFAVSFHNSRMPFVRKKSVFKSVVNETFFSDPLTALEVVRTLTASDIDRIVQFPFLILAAPMWIGRYCLRNFVSDGFYMASRCTRFIDLAALFWRNAL